MCNLRVGDHDVNGRAWLAPMTGVSDLPFRRTAARLGAAYMATEMVASAEFARGRPDVVRRAAVGEGLPLTVIQLVGREPTAHPGGEGLRGRRLVAGKRIGSHQLKFGHGKPITPPRAGELGGGRGATTGVVPRAHGE